MARLTRSDVWRSEWKGILDDAYIWLDYFGVPQIGTAAAKRKSSRQGSDARYEAVGAALVDLPKAVNSIPAYIERATLFIALCPEVEHRDLPGVVCNLGSWLDRGWCRVVSAFESPQHGWRALIRVDAPPCRRAGNVFSAVKPSARAGSRPDHPHTKL